MIPSFSFCLVAGHSRQTFVCLHDKNIEGCHGAMQMHPTDIRDSVIYTGLGPQGTLRPVDEPPGKKTFLGVALVNVLYIL
jgi:hypothetical protein